MNAHTHCLNCNYPLKDTDHFCGNCGQDTHSNKIPFKHFMLEFLEGIFHFDTKIWYTLRQLFLSPGLVIKAFNENKRMRYVPPIRLYIFVSVLFFLLTSSGVQKSAHAIDKELQKKVMTDSFNISLISGTKVDALTNRKLIAIPEITNAQVDSILTAARIKTNALNNRAIKQIVHLKRGETTAEEISHTFMTSISKILFLLMPIFAFLVWIVCGRKKLFYAETLVFSLYFHSFYFLLLLLSVLLGYVFTIENSSFYVYLLACLYLVSSVKFAFSKSWLRAALLSFILIVIYTILFGLVFFMAVVGSFIF